MYTIEEATGHPSNGTTCRRPFFIVFNFHPGHFWDCLYILLLAELHHIASGVFALRWQDIDTNPGKPIFPERLPIIIRLPYLPRCFLRKDTLLISRHSPLRSHVLPLSTSLELFTVLGNAGTLLLVKSRKGMREQGQVLSLHSTCSRPSCSVHPKESSRSSRREGDCASETSVDDLEVCARSSNWASCLKSTEEWHIFLLRKLLAV